MLKLISLKITHYRHYYYHCYWYISDYCPVVLRYWCLNDFFLQKNHNLMYMSSFKIAKTKRKKKQSWKINGFLCFRFFVEARKTAQCGSFHFTPMISKQIQFLKFKTLQGNNFLACSKRLPFLCYLNFCKYLIGLF